MRPHPVESFVIPAVKDESLPSEIPGFKPGVAFIGKLLTNCPGIIADPMALRVQDTLPFSDPNPYETNCLDEIQLSWPSPHHLRSFEVKHKDLDEIWVDEFGHKYSSLNLKGNNFSSPGVVRSGTASRRVVGYGLQESAVMRRVLRASRLLRTNDISTEYILGLAEPKTLPWPLTDSATGYIETTSIAEYKRRIVEAEWKQMPDEERSAEAMVELSSAFEKMTFYVSARAMDTSARLRDIIADYDVRGEVFELYNRHFNNNDDEPYINTVTDTLRFVREVFIPKAAANLARIHNLGLAHRFPNDLNYTAFGSLVDLDSVHGAPLELGDEEITGKDKARDLLITLYGIDYAQNHIHLLSHNRDIKIDLKSEFLKAYFSDLVAAYGSDDDRLTVASEVVFGVQELVDSENDDDFLGSNRHYMRNKIYDIFVDMFQPLDAMGIGMVDTWLDAELPKLYENALKAVKETVPLYALDLMDEFINEKSDNPDFDIAGLCISNPMKLGRIFEWVQATIIESVESAFNKYLDELAASASPEESASSMWTRRVGILHSQQYNWFKKLEGWSSDTVYRVISDLKDEFTEALNVNWQPRLFPEYRAWPIRSTSPNRYFMETMEVPLAEVMNYIEREKPDLTIEQLQKNSDAGIEFNIEITDDGSIGSELISDGVYDGMSSDYEPVMRAFSLGMPKNGSYILVVEEKPNGTKRLRLFFENEHLVNALNNIGNVMQVLRENIYFQQTLFK